MIGLQLLCFLLWLFLFDQIGSVVDDIVVESITDDRIHHSKVGSVVGVWIGIDEE